MVYTCHKWFLTFKMFFRWRTPPVSEHLGSCHVTQMKREQVLIASFSRGDPVSSCGAEEKATTRRACRAVKSTPGSPPPRPRCEWELWVIQPHQGQSKNPAAGVPSAPCRHLLPSSDSGYLWVIILTHGTQTKIYSKYTYNSAEEESFEKN